MAKNPARKPLSEEDRQEIYGHLAICLSRITGFPINQINPNDSLDQKYHFNAGGKVALAAYLESYFEKVGRKFRKRLDRGQMQAAQTVQQVYLLVLKAVEG